MVGDAVGTELVVAVVTVGAGGTRVKSNVDVKDPDA